MLQNKEWIKKVFYNLSILLSFSWAWLLVIIGARRRGKTYAVKKWLLTGWLYDGEQFLILRDTDDECEIIAKDGGERFWGDVLEDRKFKNKDIKIEMTKDSVYVNGELAGYVMPVSLFYKFKGSQYNKVKRILYDEFIREKQVRYNGNRAWQFINTLFSITSYRTDFKIILTANALDKGDTLLVDLFNININGFGIYKRRDKGVVLDYARNSEEFEEYQKSGNMYNLVKGTRWEGNLVDNQFLNDNDSMFYDKKKPCDLFGIYYSSKDDTFVRVYESKDGDTFYAGKDTNPNTANYMRYTFDIKSVNNRVRMAGNDEKKKLQLLYSNNLIKFENSFILNVFKEIIK